MVPSHLVFFSCTVIVLQALAVAAHELGLNEFVIAVFMVVSSILKALQVKYKFDVVAAQCEKSVACLRDLHMMVENARIETQHSKKGIDKEDFDKLRKGVMAAIGACPSHVIVQSSEIKASTQKIHRTKSMKGDRFRETVGAEKGALHSQEHYELGSGSETSERGRNGDVVVDEVDRGQRQVRFRSDVDSDPRDSEALSVADPMQNSRAEAAHYVQDGEQGGHGVQAGQLREKEVVTNLAGLMDLLKSVDVGAKFANRLAHFLFLANALAACFELTLNVVNAAGFGNVAILASTNTVFKGLQVKLALDVRLQEANEALVLFKKFQGKVAVFRTRFMGAKDSLSGQGFDMAQEFNALVEEYEELCTVYAKWLEGPKLTGADSEKSAPAQE